MTRKIIGVLVALVIILYATSLPELVMFATSSPLDKNLVNQSVPFMPAQPLQYAFPFPEYMPDVLMNMNIVTVYSQLDWVVAYELKDFLKFYEQAAVSNSELSEVVEKITQKNNSHLPIVIFPGNLPPAIYDLANPTQQSPR